VPLHFGVSLIGCGKEFPPLLEATALATPIATALAAITGKVMLPKEKLPAALPAAAGLAFALDIATTAIVANTNFNLFIEKSPF
jgi:hypothetical protein